MPSSSIDQLPDEIREEFGIKIREKRFSQITELWTWLETRLKQEGLKIRISRSAVGRYSKRVKRNLKQIEESTEIARFLKGSEDERGDLNDAVIRIALAKNLHMLSRMSDKEFAEKFAQINRSLPELSRSSLQVKKLKQTYREKTRRTAKKVGKALAGKTPEATIEKVEQMINGIFPEEES